MAFTALDALREGYEVRPIVDAVGGISPRPTASASTA
jgi:nicotinamidase-related amidase